MAGAERCVAVSVSGQVARIRLTQPSKLNVVTLALADQLLEAIGEISRTPHVRTLVISGEGRAFSAGGDLGYLRNASPEVAERDAGVLIARLHEGITALTSLPIPTVASAHGAVAGAGLSLLLACDFAIAAEDTRFVFAYSQIGASPDGGLTWALSRMLGARRALDFAFLKRQMNADEAHECGLIHRKVAASELESATEAMAVELAAISMSAFRQTKRLLDDALSNTLDQQLEAERTSFQACTRTADFQEGIAAFFGRRIPHFR